MKVRRILLVVVLLLTVSAVGFYLWGSRGRVDVTEHFYQSNYHVAAKPKDTLTFMTYNIGYLSGMTNNLPVERPKELFETNLLNAKKLLRQLQPDIVGYQEMDFGSKRSYFVDQSGPLAFGSDMHQAYASVNWDKNYVPFPYWPPRHHFGRMLSGQAIHSKYPMENMETLTLEKPVNAPFYYNRFYLDRLVQMSDVRIGERVIKVMNLHLEAFDAETRERQAVVVRELYDRYSDVMPVLLIGDFNSRPYWEEGADRAMETLLAPGNIASAITREVYDLQPADHFTFSSGEPYQMIDYILYNPRFIRPVQARVVAEAGQISDHLPVMMCFVFVTENDGAL